MCAQHSELWHNMLWVNALAQCPAAKLGWLILGGFECTLHFDEPEKEDSMRRAWETHLLWSLLSVETFKNTINERQALTLVLSDASKALPLRVEGRGGTHHILDGWGSAQESVQGNGHGGGLWSPGWGMPEEKGTEKGRGFWHSRPSWSHFSLMDWWGASYVRPGGSQEPISTIIKSLCHSVRWNFSSIT